MKHTFKRLVRLSLPYKWWMVLAAFIGFLTVGSSVGLLMTSAYIIAKAALQPSIAELQVAIVGVRFFGISRGLFRYLERLISHNVTFKLLAKFRIWFFRALEPLAPARLQPYKSGDLLARAVSDINTLEHFYVRVLAPPLVAVLTSLLMWLLFGLYSWWFAWIVCASLALAGVGVPWLTLKTSRGLGNQLVDLHSKLSIMAVESTQGLPELLMFGQAEPHHQEWRRLNNRLIRLQHRQAVLFALHEALIGLLMNAALFSLFVVAAPQVQNNALSGIALTVLVLGTMAAFEAVMPLPAAAVRLEESLRAAERLFEITEAEPPIISPAQPSPRLRKFDISFEHVSFAYESHQPVLMDISFQVKDGERLLVTGASGSGKSTLANLLLRFWEVSSGRIRIGGHDIREFSQQELAELISYVPQQPYLFTGTLRDNLRLAHPGATEHEMQRVCRMVKLGEFISHLPDGYDTWIGEYGLRLSGGERQRLAMAQGLLKPSHLLILDEPTAHLDAENARNILHSVLLEEVRSIIIISHELVHLKNVKSLKL